jgi:hypothetical protein
LKEQNEKGRLRGDVVSVERSNADLLQRLQNIRSVLESNVDVLMTFPNILSALKNQIVDLPSPANTQQDADALALMAMQESDGE